MLSDAAEIVLCKSITFLREEEHGHSTISEIDYSYEFIEDFQDPQGERYHNITSFFTSKEPPIFLENNMAMHTVETGVTLQSVRQMTFTLNDNDAANNPPIDTHKQGRKNNSWGPKMFEKENHVIKLMV